MGILANRKTVTHTDAVRLVKEVEQLRYHFRFISAELLNEIDALHRAALAIRAALPEPIVTAPKELDINQ